tara:strand:- start:59 stop:1024 length:966 start_codon:yes stop_codon:yes gene_type:complete
VDPQLSDGNSVDVEGGELIGNSEELPQETEAADSSTEIETGESSDGENGDSSFWSGNPMELAPENLAIYKEMQSGLTKKSQEISDMRRDMDSDRAKLSEQQNQLQQAFLALQAQKGEQVQGNGPGDRGDSQETGPTIDELRERFTEKAKSGDGFGALLEIMDARLGGSASQREHGLREELAALQGKVNSLTDTFKPHQEAGRLNAVFEDLKSGSYREFKDERVQQGVRDILDSGDPTVMSLLSVGTDDAYRAALSLAGERAIRSINEGRLIENAKRRADAGSPTNASGTSSSPVGSTASMSMDEILDQVLGQNADLKNRFS